VTSIAMGKDFIIALGLTLSGEGKESKS